jgi:ankyrin repeat protein
MFEEFPLHKAACDPSKFYCQNGGWRERCADYALVRKLIEEGADVNQIDDLGRTPLHVTLSHDAATVLLGAGADPLALDHDFLLPHQWRDDQGKVRNKSSDVFFLIEDMQQPTAFDANGFTPLHRVRDAKVAEQLIARGGDVNAVANGPMGFGQSPLHNCDPYIAEVLLTHGADINVRDSRGLTPLDCAWAQLNLKTLLLANGATGRQSARTPSRSQ